LAPFFEDKFSLSAEADEIIRHEQAIHVLRAFHDALEAGCPEGQDQYSCALESARKKSETKGKALYMPIRAALTGTLKGPELDKIYRLLGRKTVLERLQKVLLDKPYMSLPSK
jgi:nondiscriminating glutamyl-tRNA synthetase